MKAIHGGVRRGERRQITEEFTKNRDCQILLATDAAGEGLNLQAAHLMVNYDLPWNPNRIEQRFGRIHRIGQEEVCRLWNLVACNTREGEVFTRLLDKIEEQRKAYGGKVFDVLGEAFTETPLRNLLLDAIRYGERPDVQAKMHEVIDASIGPTGSRSSSKSGRWPPSTSPKPTSQALRAAMDEARARRLQPHYIELAFKAAFTRLGGRIAKREQGRYEIANVPAHIRASKHQPDRHQVRPRHLRPRARPTRRPGARRPARARAPAARRRHGRGHPSARRRPQLAAPCWSPPPWRSRTCWLASSRKSPTPPAPVRRPALRLRLRRQLRHGHPRRAGALPRLRRRTRQPSDRRPPASCLGWPTPRTGRRAGSSPTSCPSTSPRCSPGGRPNSPRPAVWSSNGSKANETGCSSTPRSRQRKNEPARSRRSRAESLNRKAVELDIRLRKRLELLDQQALMSTKPPHIVTAALVLPIGMLEGELPASAPIHAKETKEVERRGVDLVLACERRARPQARRAVLQQQGLRHPVHGRRTGDTYRIEVKARIDGATDFFVTHNEVMTGKNAVPRYRLALVRVDPRGPHVRRGPLPR